ncbi:M23 family metallopeptidase [Lachnospiraceae bacterium LCP25S3_G4]
MNKMRAKKIICLELLVLTILCGLYIFQCYDVKQASGKTTKQEFIKWVDFDVPAEALEKAYQWDVDTYQQEVHLNWIELLAYLGTKYGGEFSQYKSSDLNELAELLIDKKKTIDLLLTNKKYYNYYLETYSAVLGGMVGEYEIEVPIEDAKVDEGKSPQSDVTTEEAKTQDEITKKWEKRYGLKAFSPIARGYEYSDYDDFGTSRSYGYSRPHLGHDMMGQTGTPIIAIESGVIEAIGWNQYGGWRLGIRSFDKKRYYYYAHLRQNFPYNKSLEEGSVVQAGDVIAYMGHTGYSSKENVNNINETHLHWGLQLIFDESQKEGNNEIWVDCYQLTRFLSKNRCRTWKDLETKEYHRTYRMKDYSVPTELLELEEK